MKASIWHWPYTDRIAAEAAAHEAEIRRLKEENAKLKRQRAAWVKTLTNEQLQEVEQQ